MSKNITIDKSFSIDKATFERLLSIEISLPKLSPLLQMLLNQVIDKAFDESNLVAFLRKKILDDFRANLHNANKIAAIKWLREYMVINTEAVSYFRSLGLTTAEVKYNSTNGQMEGYLGLGDAKRYVEDVITLAQNSKDFGSQV